MTEFIITCQSELQKDGSYKIERYRELARCKGCKYWRKLLLNHNGDGVCHADNPIRVSNENWYCADGVAKDINVPDREGR